MTIAETASGKQQVGGEGRQELRHRLHAAGAARGRRPTQMPIGTQIRLASAISTSTRSMVEQAEQQRLQRSPGSGMSGAHDGEVPDADDDRGDQASAFHSRSPIGRWRSCSGTRDLRVRRGRRVQRNDASKAASTGRVMRSIRLERRSMVSAQESRPRRPCSSLDAEAVRPRRPAAGTAAGRRAG